LPISSVALVAGDVAVPVPLNASVPINVPPVAQSEVLVAIALGLHKKNVTVPVGTHKKNVTVPVGTGPAVVPVTVALSNTDVPGVTVVEVVLDIVLISDSPFSTVKHSLSIATCLSSS